MSFPSLSVWPRPLIAGALVLLAACGGGSRAPSVRTGVAVQPVPAARGEVAAPLPDLPLPATGGMATTGPRIQNLDMVEQDLSLVLRKLAESYNLDHQIDPGVGGRVTMRLSDVTLEQALDALVSTRGYQFQIQDNVLRVMPTRLATRMFTLDYVSLSRIGVASTVVQRALGGIGGSSGMNGGYGGMGGGAVGGAGGLGGGVGGMGGMGGIGGGGAGGNSISSITVADLWEEIRVALDGLIFDEALGEGAAGSNPTGQAGAGLGGRGAGPFSRTVNGRRLILNPLAGVITVTAPPEKLAEVEAYITTIERSVQRQVLIEAKIVEVTLDRSFEFGIDWNVLRTVGGVDLSFGTGAGGAQFTVNERGGNSGAAISLILRALESQGDVSVLSSPRVAVLNNQPAVFNVTTDDVFFAVTRQPLIGPTGATIGFNTQIIPQQISVGITLDVIAQIAPDNVITMNVRPVVTDVIAEKSVQLEDGTQATAPVIDRRETDTMVRVRGGETIVIGGLMQTRETSRRRGVPGLRSLPGVGALFGGVVQEREKRELVIFITPRIVAGQSQVGD